MIFIFQFEFLEKKEKKKRGKKKEVDKCDRPEPSHHMTVSAVTAGAVLSFLERAELDGA